MSVSEKAVALHEKQRYNCCQSILCSVCDHCGIDDDTAYHLGAFFGAGMRCGEVCGALTGTLMALGLKYGDENNRQCRVSRDFLEQFEQKYGTLLCRDLLRQNGKAGCERYIEFAAHYLEEHL